MRSGQVICQEYGSPANDHQLIGLGCEEECIQRGQVENTIFDDERTIVDHVPVIVSGEDEAVVDSASVEEMLLVGVVLLLEVAISVVVSLEVVSLEVVLLGVVSLEVEASSVAVVLMVEILEGANLVEWVVASWVAILAVDLVLVLEKLRDTTKNLLLK